MTDTNGDTQGAAPADEHVHLFAEAGIEEGGKPVPRWYIAVLLTLGVFFVAYVVLHFTGVQPNSAR